MKQALFLLAFSTLLAHELDAVAQAEWRVLPLTRFLPEAWGYQVFVLAHIPLLAGLLWLLMGASSTLRLRTQQVLSAFMVVHGGLHAAFSGDPHYHFDSALSQGLIAGAGLSGAAYLLASRGRA